MATRTELTNALTPIFQEVLGLASAESVVIDIGLDHDDEPSIFVRARVSDPGQITSSENYSKLLEKVHEKLYSLGEVRFPYIKFDFGDVDNTIDDSAYSAKVRRRG